MKIFKIAILDIADYKTKQMNLFDVIHAKTSLNAIIGSIRLSLHDLREKHEHRKDLIETLEKYEIWMSETRDTLSAMEDENKQLIKRLAQYHTEYLKLKRENNELKEIL
jgi:predicted nuclease with TOPRIM domain